MKAANEIVYWKQRNGELISIDDMDINHLRNTLKMIIRKHKDNLEKEKYWKKQNNRFFINGDMANEFNNTDIDHDESDLGYQFNDDECRGNQW
jgi:hypothetical protein